MYVKSDGKKMNANEAMAELVKNELSLITPGGDPETQAKIFMEAIKMTRCDDIVRKAFVVSCKMGKINYNNMLATLSQINAHEDYVRKTLTNAFRNWILRYRGFEDEYPHANMLTLINAFATRWREKK